MLGNTMAPVAPETLGDQHPYLRGEGIAINFDIYRGASVDAGLAEASIKRLYEHIERLTEAHEERE